METSPSPPPPLVEEDQEWELRHDDDGFVYKILRSRGGPTTTAEDDAPAAAVLKAQEKRRRRERKRRALLRLKAKYQSEIDQWGILSNTLKEMQERTSHEVGSRPEEAPPSEEPGPAENHAEEGAGSEIDKLLAKVEAQEAVIRRASNLCDIAEAMCNAQEERLVQSFMDLPVWSSPRELMASLCDE